MSSRNRFHDQNGLWTSFVGIPCFECYDLQLSCDHANSTGSGTRPGNVRNASHWIPLVDIVPT
jgi:hypothetical protein